MPTLTNAQRADIVAAELRPLEDELRAMGLTFREIPDDAILRAPLYGAAIGKFLAFLQGGHSDRSLASVAGLLTGKAPEIKAAWSDIVALYRAAPGGEGPPVKGDTAILPLRTKEALANAVLAAFTPKKVPDLLALLEDPDNGPSRVILLRALKRRRTAPDVALAVETLRSDPDLNAELSRWT
ncbi:hypothetical protein [Tateyamaria sp. SN3-11]|uniref:hypothetical protein n=1 Tax=Tateyamaria sp. SN3-11 TaxID=3092147 RepID=UPI0039E76ED8